MNVLGIPEEGLRAKGKVEKNQPGHNCLEDVKCMFKSKW